MNRPNFFIVGAPKCGTTAMNDYLAAQPGIFMAKKEIHYFGADLKTRLRITESEYLSFFSEAGTNSIIGEASVWYLYSRTAAAEIKAFAPSARILIMLRSPVDVIHSLHSQHLFDGNETITDFETAVSLDDQRRQGKSLPASLDFFELPPYLDSVKYADQVKRYFDTFGKQNVKVVLYDDFRKDTAGVVDDVLKFLGRPKAGSGLYPVVNPNKDIRFFGLHRLMKNPSRRLKRLVRVLVPFRFMRHWMMATVFRLNIVPAKRGAMREEFRKQLLSKLAEDIRQLESVIGRDLSAWME